MQVISDARDFGVGAVLLQEGRPVAYFSKKLNQAERNYSTTEKELAGVLYALCVLVTHIKCANDFLGFAWRENNKRRPRSSILIY
jgi:hypothetical protein